MGVVVRADPETGMGHLVRCLSLARTARRRGVETWFVASPGDLVGRAAVAGGFPVLDPGAGDPADVACRVRDLLSEVPVDAALFDLLEPALAHHRVVAGAVPVIASIQAFDYSLERFENVAFHPGGGRPRKERVASLGGGEMVLHRGRDHLVFREEFLLPLRRRFRSVGTRLLISMGGADLNGYTLLAMRGAEALDLPIEGTVILGRACPLTDEVYALAAAGRKRWSVLRDVDDLRDRMVATDVAMINGGMTRYEVARTGTPFVAISMHETQFRITEEVTGRGAGVNLGIGGNLTPGDVAEALDTLLRDREARRVMSHRGRRLFDGRGGERILDEILGRVAAAREDGS